MHSLGLCPAFPRACSPCSQPEDHCAAPRARRSGITIFDYPEFALDETFRGAKILVSE